jgi:amino acid transporter
VAALGLLLAQYTFTGYDASAHMIEETKGAATAGPRGIVMSIVVSLIAGWVLLIGLTFAIQDYEAERTSAIGVPPAQIFIDAAGRSLGMMLLVIVVVAQLFCGMASVAANSRMIFAFSRDGALPGSRVWRKVGTKSRLPNNAVWLAAVSAFVLGLPYLWNSTAYAAVTSIAVIGLYIAYVIPSYLRLRAGETFQPGPWNLGRWGRPVAMVAVGWVVVIVILFMLPTSSPVTAATFNYTPLAVLAVLGFAGIWWLVSARKWFTGPRRQGNIDELIELESHVGERE